MGTYEKLNHTCTRTLKSPYLFPGAGRSGTGPLESQMARGCHQDIKWEENRATEI